VNALRSRRSARERVERSETSGLAGTWVRIAAIFGALGVLAMASEIPGVELDVTGQFLKVLDGAIEILVASAEAAWGALT